MALPKVQVLRVGGGLGRRAPGRDHVSALVIQAPGAYPIATAENYVFYGLDQAEAQGFTAAEDATHSCLVHHHISEFFRMAPGATLWVRLVANTVLLSDIFKLTLLHAQPLLVATEGSIRQLGVVLNGAYATDVGLGIYAEVQTAFGTAQTMADHWREKHAPLHIVIEGRSLSSAPAGVMDLHTQTASSVSVVIGQQVEVADLVAHADYADVGTLMGTIAAASVQESIGKVKRFQLSSATGPYLNPGIAGKSLLEYTDTDLEMYNDKGYIFPLRRRLQETLPPGVFWNLGHTVTVQADDFATIRANRTMDKAIRKAYYALVNELNSEVEVVDGKLAPEFIDSWDRLVRNEVGQMVRDGEITDLDVFVDPDQDVIQTARIEVRVAILPKGISSFIDVTIGYTTLIS